MAKKTWGRMEKLINIIVILVMLLQPAGMPGLLLAVAEAPAIELVSEEAEEPTVSGDEPIEEESVPVAEEEIELPVSNGIEEEKSVSEPEPVEENGEDALEEEAIAPDEAVPAEEEPDVVSGESAENPDAEGNLEENRKTSEEVVVTTDSESASLEVVTYSDSGYANKADSFKQGETVYIKASGSFDPSMYYRIAIDPPAAGDIFYISSCESGISEIESSFDLAADAQVSANWKVKLRSFSSKSKCNSDSNPKMEDDSKFEVSENNAPQCGDGIKNGEEECDGEDGITSNELTCSKKCEIELVDSKVEICHATDSQSNPYISNSPDKSGDVNGHDGHSGGIWYSGIADHSWGDIIPPFEYIGGTYPGKNWSAGQEILENECRILYCGDGIINGEEQCDDGNTVDGDACTNQCELKEMKKETVRTCNGEGEMYLYVDDPFQDIATSFTTDRDQLLIFTGNPPVYSLDIKVDGAPVGKTKIFADQWVEIFAVDTVPGSLVTVEGTSQNGARNVQGYLAQDKDHPVYNIAATEVIWDDEKTDIMYLTPGEYSYLFFDKYNYNSKGQQASGNKDQRKLNVKINGLSPLVDETYTAPFPAPAEGVVMGKYTVTQTGSYALTVDTEDSIYWVLPKCEPLVPIIEVEKTANPTTMPEPGGDATFTFTVTNTGIDPVTITSLEDDIFGTLTGDNDCQVGTALASNVSCAFSSVETLTGNAGDMHNNVFTAHAENNEGVEATDDDAAAVEFTDVLPTILVTKTANPTVVPESGGDVEFVFTVQNASVFEAVTITSLSDSVYGTLDGDADCQIGTALAVGETCAFSVTKKVAGDASGPAHNNIFTAHAEDDDGTDATDDDDATVTFTDALPTVTLDKTVDDNSKPEPGGTFNYTLTITNTSAEDVTITALTDDNALSQECLDLIGNTLTPSQQVACNYSVIHTEAGTYPNTAAATVEDNEKNPASDTDNESVEVTDVLPVIEVLKTGNPTTVPESGGDVTFTYRVTNSSAEPVEITVLADDKFGTLAGNAGCQLGTVLAAGAFCEFAATFAIPAGDVSGAHVDIFTATVKDNENNPATDTDDEVITYTDVLPTVTLDKTVDDNSKPEPGGTFNYTLTITNTSVEEVTITALIDDNALSQECLDLIGDVLIPNQSVFCNYSVIHTEAGTYPNTAVATVEDNEKNPASDTDNESVEVTDVLPVIEVLKTAGVSALNVPSASVAFTFTVKNNSVEAVTVTSLTDDVFGVLAGDADCQVGTVLAPGASCSFDSTEIISGTAGVLHTDIFTVHAEDNEKNEATASDDETVTFNAGRIIVDKITDPSADPQSFSFTLAGGPNPAVSQVFSLTDLSAPHDSGLIFPGTYNVIEDVAAGWQTSADCQVENQTIFEQALAVFASSSPDRIIIEPGQTIRCTFTNTFIPPVLTIEKFNDQWPNIQNPGGTVDYTIVVRASDNNVYGAFVKDLLPQGFTFAGITSVKKNGDDLAVADPAYASPGTWKLGDLVQGDEVVIKFKAHIGSSQDPGTYKDLAWAQGTDDRQARVLATSVPALKPDQGVITDNFVGTQIELAPVTQPEVVALAESTKTETKTKRKTKRVLGAAILPATGADPIWPLVALIILIVGFNLIMESKKRAKKNFVSTNKTLMKIFILALFSGAIIFYGHVAKAAADPSISVRIEKPKAQSDTNEFKIGFVALDIQERDLTVKCFKVPNEEMPNDFVAKTGGNSGSCLINLPDGTHQFYVAAYDPSNADNYGQSETVTVEINTGAPSTPLNYSRAEDSCTVNFTTANDGLTAAVELYRSTNISFTADESTYVGTAIVGPSASGSVADPNSNCGDYYYAIRAVSKAGVDSAFIGDEKVIVKHKTRTRTRIITIHPEAATGAIPAAGEGTAVTPGTGAVEGVATEEGQVAPTEEGGAVLGEETEGVDEAAAAPENFLQKNRRAIAIIILAILVAIYVYRKKRNPGIEK